MTMLTGAQRVALVVGALGLACTLATIVIDQAGYLLFASLPNAGLEILIPVAVIALFCAASVAGMLCAPQFRSKHGVALFATWMVLAVPVVYYFTGGVRS